MATLRPSGAFLIPRMSGVWRKGPQGPLDPGCSRSSRAPRSVMMGWRGLCGSGASRAPCLTLAPAAAAGYAAPRGNK
eukprot:3076898-Pyramimonas_sp.AAC.1